MTRTRNLSIREANLRTIRDIEARIPAARTSAIDECIEKVEEELQQHVGLANAMLTSAQREKHAFAADRLRVLVSRLTALKGEG